MPSLMTVKSPLLRPGVHATRETEREIEIYPLVVKEYDLRILPADRICADQLS